MNLEEKTVNELKVIAFDIDNQIKVNQRDYQVVINIINSKLEAEAKSQTIGEKALDLASDVIKAKKK